MSKNNVPAVRFKGFDEEWGKLKFKDIAERKTQVATTPSIAVEYEDIDSGYGVLNKDLRTMKAPKLGIAFSSGDILYGKLRPYLKNWLHPDFEGVAVGDFWVLSGTTTKPSFLYHLIQTDTFTAITNISSGSKMPRADWGLVSQSLFKIPVTGSEQQNIGALFAELDDMIAGHRQKLEKLQQVKASLLQKMFPQGDAIEPELRIKGFTGAWTYINIGTISSIGSGRDYKHLNSGPIPVYGTGGYMLSVDEALSYSRDAIGIGRKGTIDRPFILKAPFWTVDTLFYVLPNESTDFNFLQSQFERIDWKDKDESTGVPSLSKEAIGGVKVRIPSPDEQRAIGEVFSQLDDVIAGEKQYIEKLQQVKASLLQKMFV